jgi:PBP1b-binding outer membrane lipoprotein LpoB
LSKVQFVVQEGALAELSWSSLSGALRQTAPEKQIQYDWPAMTLKLENVLSGERVWTRKVDSKPFVQGYTLLTGK